MATALALSCFVGGGLESKHDCRGSILGMSNKTILGQSSVVCCQYVYFFAVLPAAYFHLDFLGHDTCIRIESARELANILAYVRDQPYDKMCCDLGVVSKTCIKLKLEGKLRLDTIAEAYYQQFPEACWEDIVYILCEDYFLKRLANDEIVNKYKVSNSVCK